MKQYSEDDIQRGFWRRDKMTRREAVHPCVRAFFEDKAIKLKELVNEHSIQNILDCGCGNGYFQTYLSQIFGTPCVGLDYSPSMLKINRNPDCVLASATNMPFPDRSFELVVCHGLIHHLPPESQMIAIQEMTRVTQKYVFIGEPNSGNPAIKLQSFLFREERQSLTLTEGRLKEFCIKSGLKIISTFKRGIVMPNKTPLFLLPVLKALEDSAVSSKYGHCIYLHCERV